MNARRWGKGRQLPVVPFLRKKCRYTRVSNSEDLCHGEPLMQASSRWLLCLFLCLGVWLNSVATQMAKTSSPYQKKALPTASSIDLTKQPTLYVVGYAHLDTQWRWEYPQTIREYLSKTLRNNFALADKYPHYIFNFSGANRYRLISQDSRNMSRPAEGFQRAPRWRKGM